MSKIKKFFPLGISDGAVLKRDIDIDEIISLDDVTLDIPADVIDAREYQYRLAI